MPSSAARAEVAATENLQGLFGAKASAQASGFSIRQAGTIHQCGGSSRGLEREK
jgi:hypothetical protein